MSAVDITNRNFASASCSMSAGDKVELAPGTYKEPLVIEGKLGTQKRPIFINPPASAQPGSVIFKSEMSTSTARAWANGVADRRQRGGYYPSFGHLGDQSMLVLRNCQYVIISGIDFKNCWPGGIYLDNCQYIVIHDVRFEGGTIAIGANGIFTHDIFIQHCHWQQDTSGTDMWDKVPWGRIHGASDNSEVPGVDLKGDYRHWDGDFFRGWDVGGNVVIRNNTITDAFNGIHFFNSIDRLAPGVVANSLAFNNGRRSAANILIENNDFVRIRDNVFEPEDHAWNWVVRHNRLIDCYRPFSFEFERAGYIYIYGNTGSFAKSPSQKMSVKDMKRFPQSEWRRSVSLFKPKGKQANEGNIYVTHNSWYFEKGKGVLPKFGLGKLVHLNNVIQYKKPKKGRFFGANGHTETYRPLSLQRELKAEQSRFTRRWGDNQIEMNADVTNDELYPDRYRMLGYNIGLAAKNANPSFKKPLGTLSSPPNFSSVSKSILKQSISFNLELPDGNNVRFPGGLNRGAVQDKNGYAKIDQYFQFLPDTSWLPSLSLRKLTASPSS